MKAALLATGAHTVSGRLTLNGHAFETTPVDEPAAVKSDERAAMRAARLWIRKVLADGPRPEADVARRLAEMGLAHLLQPAADALAGALPARAMVAAGLGVATVPILFHDVEICPEVFCVFVAAGLSLLHAIVSRVRAVNPIGKNP